MGGGRRSAHEFGAAARRSCSDHLPVLRRGSFRPRLGAARTPKPVSAARPRGGSPGRARAPGRGGLRSPGLVPAGAQVAGVRGELAPLRLPPARSRCGERPRSCAPLPARHGSGSVLLLLLTNGFLIILPSCSKSSGGRDAGCSVRWVAAIPGAGDRDRHSPTEQLWACVSFGTRAGRTKTISELLPCRVWGLASHC